MNDDKKIDKLSSDISDGNAVDWNDYDESTKNPLVVKLSVINDIANFFKQSHSNGEYDSSIHKILFEWGHLQVKELIGEGSYGEVYKAYDSVLDRNVALKLIKENNIAPYQSRAFIQEAKNLAKIRNRHVLAIHGVNVNDSRVGIWSDLINGKNLSNLHNKTYRYNFTELLHICQSITEALIAVHESGLIHGDIKAANVMQDEKGKIILMDFDTGSEISESSINVDYISGTPLLMAPELLAGESKTQVCDIYSFGVLLFKLATGNYPINGKNLADVHKAHKDGSYLSFKDFDTKIPRNMKNLIKQMISINPLNRPTADELKKKITHIIHAPQRRKKRMVVSFIASILILGIIISSLGFYKANQAKIIAVQEKNKAQASSNFLSDLLASPSSTGKGKDVKVADLLDIASIELRESTVLQAEVKATVFYALGRSYVALQLPDDALVQYQESLNYYQQLYGDESLESLKVMVGLLSVSDMLGDEKTGLEITNQILDI